jgi:hypothetical protein
MMTDADGYLDPVEWGNALCGRHEVRDPLVEYLALVGARGDDRAEPERLVAKLEAAPLRALSAPGAPRRPGVYALYLAGWARPVYIGKAAGVRGLQGRLADHLETLQLHQHLDAAQVGCRFVVYARGEPVAHLEAALIRHYRPLWNTLVGFGSGRARKGLPPTGRWERWYPRR